MVNGLSLDIRMPRSFLIVAETGSVTETARRLGRTLPAISLQLHRLEELTGKSLFAPESRRPRLTVQGEVVLGYAKSILRLHDELLNRLATPEVEGHVVPGTPDLYAAYLLPSVLAMFREAFPRIQVELRCKLSTPLVSLVQRGEVDLALVTRMRGFSGGEVVRPTDPAQGRSASNAAATRTIRASSLQGATSCRPTGSPARLIGQENGAQPRWRSTGRPSISSTPSVPAEGRHRHRGRDGQADLLEQRQEPVAQLRAVAT